MRRRRPVGAVQPEQDDENQHDLRRREQRKVVREDRCQLGQREDEDQIEKELQGRDA